MLTYDEFLATVVAAAPLLAVAALLRAGAAEAQRAGGGALVARAAAVLPHQLEEVVEHVVRGSGTGTGQRATCGRHTWGGAGARAADLYSRTIWSAASSATELAMLLLRLRRPTLLRRDADGDGVRVISTPRCGKYVVGSRSGRGANTGTGVTDAVVAVAASADADGVAGGAGEAVEGRGGGAMLETGEGEGVMGVWVRESGVSGGRGGFGGGMRWVL